MFEPGQLLDLPSLPTITGDEVGQRLLKAAELIEKHGWCQGSYGHDAVGYCALGAIAKAEHVSICDVRYTESARRIAKYIDESRVDEWNDADGRTQSEVISALRQAAMTRL